MISWVWKCISVLTGVNWGESSKKENALQEIIHKSEVTGIPVNISCNQTLDNEFFFFFILWKKYTFISLTEVKGTGIFGTIYWVSSSFCCIESYNGSFSYIRFSQIATLHYKTFC